MNELALSSALLPPLLRAALSALAFGWVAVAFGRRLLKMGQVSLASATIWEKCFIAGAFGAAALQYLPYALGASGMLHPAPVRWAVFGLTLVLGFDLFAVARCAVRSLCSWSLKLSPDLAVWLALGTLLMCVLLVRSSTIGDFGDDDGYHLSSPKRWLSLGSLSYLPSYTNTNASMGFEMLYAVGLAVWDAVAAKAIHYAAGVFALLGVFLCALQLSSARAGLIAVSLILIANHFVNVPYVFALAYVDLGACWMAMACLWCWLSWRERQDTKLLVCMALCAGFTGSFKTTAIVLGIAWMPPLLIELRKRGESWQRSVTKTAVFGLISLLPIAPWFFRNYRVTGNPLYPMLSSIVETRDWPASHAHVFSKYTRFYAWGISSGSRLGETQRKEILLGAALLIALTAAFAMLRTRRVDLRAIVLFSATFTVLSVLLAGLLFRYWLPAVMSASVVVGVIVADLPSVARWRLWPASPLMLLALGSVVREEPNGHELKSDLRLSLGLRTLDEERQTTSYAWPIWKYINAHTPSDARVMIAAFYQTFGSASLGAFWVDRTCFATDSHLQTYIPFDSWTAFVSRIRSARIDYVVISERPPAVDRRGFAFVAGQNEYPFCRRLVQQYGEKLLQSGDLAAYRIRPPVD